MQVASLQLRRSIGSPSLLRLRRLDLPMTGSGDGLLTSDNKAAFTKYGLVRASHYYLSPGIIHVNPVTRKAGIMWLVRSLTASVVSLGIIVGILYAGVCLLTR